MLVKKLAASTSVFLKNEGINPEISIKFKGPFTVLKIDSRNNYLLKYETGTVVDGKFPLSRLKVVESEVDKEKSYEIEKILNHKDEDKSRQYLVQWKGYDNKDNSWISENNFNSNKIINKYLKFLKETTVKEKPLESVRRSSRKKNNNLVLILLLSFMISLVSGSEKARLIDL